MAQWTQLKETYDVIEGISEEEEKIFNCSQRGIEESLAPAIE